MGMIMQAWSCSLVSGMLMVYCTQNSSLLTPFWAQPPWNNAKIETLVKCLSWHEADFLHHDYVRPYTSAGMTRYSWPWFLHGLPTIQPQLGSVRLLPKPDIIWGVMTYCEMIYVISLQISYFEDNLFRKDALSVCCMTVLNCGKFLNRWVLIKIYILSFLSIVNC
jgi:hypothetical protein